MNRRWLVGIGVLLVLIAAILYLMRDRLGFPEQVDEQAETEIVEVFVGDLSASASASGHVRAEREAMLSIMVPGVVTKVLVQVGDTVSAGDLLLQLDDRDLRLNLESAEQALRMQQANLDSLKRPASEAEIAAADAQLTAVHLALEQLLLGTTAEEVAAAEANVRSAEASVRNAQGNLADVLAGVDEAQIAAARGALAEAQLRLDVSRRANEANPNIDTHTAWQDAVYAVSVAQAELDRLLGGPNQDAVAAARASASAAEAQLDAAKANLAQITTGATAAQIAAARAQVAQAEATLDALRAGATNAALRRAEAQVAQAQLNVDGARNTLEQAQLRAPFAGVITAVAVVEGEFANGPVVELASFDEPSLVLQVDEIDIGRLSTGQSASVTLETWPSTPIQSTVTRIIPGEREDGAGLVTYSVFLTLNTDLPLRIGMTGNASLITAERENVLLLPNRAINVDRERGRFYVNVRQGEEVEQVDITIGLRDRDVTQITSGLEAGDQVVVGNDLPIGSFGPPREGGPPGQN